MKSSTMRWHRNVAYMWIPEMNIILSSKSSNEGDYLRGGGVDGERYQK
jgi:hypothetical protein